ncbi:stage II sporulation protein D [Haloplasma contractile]|uniref:Stage II sporulation protein D n=1 Tax=Haloplasma contractile SSD-17B TaxID=1033810 RepID=U2FJQ7_9MOLU|nr:stage II sporulation protein D [Haloplasma contractile]ERJ13045.1 Stage II sporulation protein D [Haloplasma contractile SSD-17B]
MFVNYHIKNENNEEVLYLYLDEMKTEFAKEFLDSNDEKKKQGIKEKVEGYIDEQDVSFKGKVVKIIAGGLVVGSMLLGGAPDINRKVKAATTISTANHPTHQVQYGETLSGIASRYNLTVDEVMMLNNLSSDRIYEGQSLRLGQTVTASTYSVRSGDTLSGIANRFGTTVNDLKALNNLTGDRIYIGQTLNVKADSHKTTHTVKSGDTLSEIALRYEISTNELKRINNLLGDTIYEGQVLKLQEARTGITHEVEPGDTLYDIARQYGITINHLKSMNNLERDAIYPGELLIVNTRAESGNYTVKSGDTLSEIASDYGMRTSELITLNNLTSDRIYVGQTLKVIQGATNVNTYTVESGDNLSTIAGQFGMSTNELRELNNLSGDLIHPGQVLNVRMGTNTTTPTTPDRTITEERTVTVERYNGVVEYISLEEYIVGVVAAEMPPYFDEQALRAQAVAARTYAIERIDQGRRLSDTDYHQVYKDELQLRDQWGNQYEFYYNRIKSAVEYTEGEVITYNGDYIDALFFSTSNGRTENPKYVWGGELPYLQSVDSHWDTQSDEFYREYTYTYDEFSRLFGLSERGLYADVISRTEGGAVDTINIGGTTYSGEDVRRRLRLRSMDFDINFENGQVRIAQRGWGHRVGLSQYGAHFMGQEGYTYDDIINHYYQGVQIELA